MPFSAIDAANSCLSRSRKLVEFAKLPEMIEVRDDLLRSALVMVTSAMDSYMHWLVYGEITRVAKKGKLPGDLARLGIPFEDFASLADATIVGRRKKIETRPWNQIRNAAQKQLLAKTFQGYDQVKVAMSMAGIIKGWSKTADVLQISCDEIRDRLNHIVLRRNHIVHEGI